MLRFANGPAFAAGIVLLLLTALPTRAALFDDEEARRRIDALRTRVEQLERSLAQRLDTLEATVKSQALVDLLRDVEQIKADIAQIRGQYEVLSYELEQAQKRQRDLYLDLDSRLRKLESAAGPSAPAAGAAAPGVTIGEGGTATAAPGTAPPPPPVTAGAQPGRAGTSGPDVATEQRAYDAALDQFKSGNYGVAITSFQTFVRTYPRSALAPSALYWAGNAQYALRDFRAAIATQRQLLATYPDSQKVPDALLNIASCQIEMGDTGGARRTLEVIIAKHPTSEAAAKARQRLTVR